MQPTDPAWRVEVALSPPDAVNAVLDRASWPAFEAVVREVASRMGATWSSGEIEAHVAEVEAGVRPGESWLSYIVPRYVLTATKRAPAAEEAAAAALSAGSGVPDGWSLQEIETTPAA